MTTVAVLHHALGRTTGVTGFAETLAADGHTVVVPDLFDGRTFTEVADGVAYADALGPEAVAAGFDAAVPAGTDPLVVVGFSLGVLGAQRIAQTRPGVAGAVLCHSCIPAAWFGAWPATVPVRVHACAADPFFTGDGDDAAARELVAAVPGAMLHLYPGAGHLFAEPGTPDHVPAAAALLERRVRAFVAAVSGRS
ncbi:dienelactone hydrolase family protein [Pseudonocardia sp. ICBG601]|uniref:dienelactone hydrolase family protein n=1 Tax=Pseudonocardia sp. ICBG601 TaxID=2846759 RepID=UPI001CF62CB7|nr:dienelactone hydrolase family protein [Pseudonocardia sp. ICBG601]